MKKVILTLSALVVFCGAAWADFVYVSANKVGCTDEPSCRNPNDELNEYGYPVYNENGFAAFTSAVSLAPGKPVSAGARYFSTSFMSGSTPDFGITLSPTLGVPGGVYKLYHVFTSIWGNVSTDVVLGVTNVDGCTLSFTSTDKFQAQYGALTGGINTWQFLGYVTNAPAVTTPTLTFFYESGDVDAGAQHRLIVDSFLFACDDCTSVPQVGISGAYTVSSTSVTVTGVDASATAVKVYQYFNDTWTPVGQKTGSITAGTVTVPVSGLTATAQLAATQTIAGQQGCLWGVPTGINVGTVYNPRLRVALSLRETTSTGPVGTPGARGANIHFLGVTNRFSGAPGLPGLLINSSSAGWQTVTFDAGVQKVGDPANAAGTTVAGAGYVGTETVAIRVYPYRTVGEDAVTIYSSAPAESPVVTSAENFAVNWSWDTVPGADGYRLLRNLNSAGFDQGGYSEYVDVVGTTTFSDANNAWAYGTELTIPNHVQTGPSVKWNSAAGDPDPVGCISCLRSNWYVIDSIAFVIDDLTAVGPHDIYIDTIQNGSTVFYGFEDYPAGTTGVGFFQPRWSGSTEGNLAGTPNSSVVVNNAAYEGAKSMRVQWAWNGLANTKWLRLTAYTIGDPQVNINDPITIRFLYLPEGAPMPPAPPAPNLLVSQVENKTVLDWVGGHRLQTAPEVNGTYTNVVHLVGTNWVGVTLAPYTSNFPEVRRFFRLVD